MNKERTFEEIAKRLSEVKTEKDPIIIKATDEEVKVLASRGDIIHSYMLRAIHDIAEEFMAKYYVTTDIDGNPYVMIYL